MYPKRKFQLAKSLMDYFDISVLIKFCWMQVHKELNGENFCFLSSTPKFCVVWSLYNRF